MARLLEKDGLKVNAAGKVEIMVRTNKVTEDVNIGDNQRKDGWEKNSVVTVFLTHVRS